MRRRQLSSSPELKLMNLVIWLPAMFVLGIVSMLACLAFTEGCSRI
jgi:hypothetical protein